MHGKFSQYFILFLLLKERVVSYVTESWGFISFNIFPLIFVSECCYWKVYDKLKYTVFILFVDEFCF